MRKLLALLILICVFFPTAMTAMSLTSVRPWILDRSFYERIVGDERIYDAVLTRELPIRFNRTVFADADQIPLEALNIALREVVTPEYLREQAVTAVNEFFDFIEGRDTNMEVALDIAIVKSALTGEGGVRFANALARALPNCAAGQEPIAPNGRLTRCISAGMPLHEAANQIVEVLPAVLEDTPDRIVLNDPINFRQSWRSLDWFLGGVVRLGLDLTLLAAVLTTLAAALIVAYLGGDDQRQRLLWFGGSLLIPAGLFVLMGLTLTTPWLSDMLYNRAVAINWGDVQYSEAFQQAMTDMTVYVVQRVGGGFLITGVVSSLIALGVLLWSWRVPPSAQPTSKIVQIPVHNT